VVILRCSDRTVCGRHDIDGTDVIAAETYGTGKRTESASEEVADDAYTRC
jgi:hypothetical protein